MEEKKIKDMTGNRGEKIASKKPVTDTASSDAPRAPKRPFVRVAPGAEQAERISAKKAQPEQSDASQKPKADRNAEQKNGDRGHGRGKNHRRPDRGHKNAPKADAQAEAALAPEKVTPKAEPKQEQRQNRDRKHSRHDKHRDRKSQAQEQAQASPAPEKKEQPKQEQKAEQAPQGRRDKKRDRISKRDDRILTDIPPAIKREKKETAEEFTDEQLRADGLWFSLDEEPAPAVPAVKEAPAEPTETVEVVGIRFRGTGKTYYFAPAGISFEIGEHAIVETVRGMEYGDIAMGNRNVSIDEVVQPLKPVLRKSTAGDDAHFASNCELESKAKPLFYEKVKKNKLEMQLVDVEYTFDNTKLCFYFTAEGRVDFRELVKDLAAVFRTRIELRQIGVRDEARLFGGLGVCGRPFCCKAFLADFAQVSIKMAKEQNLSLASSKISGSCGRLMCCLRYEQDTYERESAALPRAGSTVDTPKGRATVLESNFLTGKIKVSDANDASIRFHTPDEVRFVAPPPRKNAPEETEEGADAEIPAED